MCTLPPPSHCGFIDSVVAKKAACLYVPKWSPSNLQSLPPSLQASEGFLDLVTVPSTDVIVTDAGLTVAPIVQPFTLGKSI